MNTKTVFLGVLSGSLSLLLPGAAIASIWFMNGSEPSVPTAKTHSVENPKPQPIGMNHH